MATLTCTPAKVGPAFGNARIRNLIGGAAVNGGAGVYVDTGGLGQVANSASATQFAGIALPRMNSGYACGSGQALEVLEWGEVEGYDLSSAAYWSLVYLQDDGTLGTTAGTHAIPVGRVVPTTDRDGSGNLRKVLMIFANWLANVS